MKITISKHSGFCFGVKRAVELAEEAADSHKGKRIFVLGELIHNPQIVEQLEKKGIKKIDDIKSVKQGDTLIIRSHGCSYEIFDFAGKNNIQIIDAICPFVKKAQDHARQLSRDGYKVIIIGKKDHPEIVGISSYAPDASIIEDEEKVSIKTTDKKVGVICQTTFNPEKFERIVAKIKEVCKEVKVFNTICEATKQRQDSALELAKKSDIMIVIGGYNSSNTKKLKEICSDITETHHIEKAEELDKSWFINKENIGIAAGASTPDNIIKEIAEKIRSF